MTIIIEYLRVKDEKLVPCHPQDAEAWGVALRGKRAGLFDTPDMAVVFANALSGPPKRKVSASLWTTALLAVSVTVGLAAVWQGNFVGGLLALCGFIIYKLERIEKAMGLD